MYTVTVCCDDPTIEKITVYSDWTGESVDVEYGDEYSFVLDSDGEPTLFKFCATPADGCEFVQWTYQINGGSDNTNLSNPFTFNTNSDMYVYVVGRESWELNTDYDFGTLYVKKQESIYLQEYTLYRIRARFDQGGLVKIYTTGDVDTYGWIGTSPIKNIGEPYSWDCRDDDSGEGYNFCMKCLVERNTTYYIWIRCAVHGDEGTTTLNISKPISGWKWTDANYYSTLGVYADATQTITAYNALIKRQSTRNFSHKVWNDMCQRVEEILEYTGRSWDSTYGSYLSTIMGSSDTNELTAKRFNAIRNNLDFVYIECFGSKMGIAKVSPGEDVLGSYFIRLAESINECFDKLRGY